MNAERSTSSVPKKRGWAACRNLTLLGAIGTLPLFGIGYVMAAMGSKEERISWIFPYASLIRPDDLPGFLFFLAVAGMQFPMYGAILGLAYRYDSAENPRTMATAVVLALAHAVAAYFASHP
jgi:hypothetical protein